MTLFYPDAKPSPRELVTLRLLSMGLTYKQVANHLHISPRTVGHHMESLYKKLDVHCMVDAFRKMGWIADE